MKQRIYLSLLLIGSACILITVSIYSWIILRSANEQAQMELAQAMAAVTAGMTEAGNPDAYLQRIGQAETGTLRLTWIDSKGTVQYESEYASDEMENHLARPEVQQALKNGSGTAVRHSQTLSRTLYYRAQRLPDGSVLRLSLERESVFSQFLSLLPLLLLLLCLTFLGCMLASRKLTASLLDPLRRTAELMEKIGTTETIRGQVPPVYQELRPLVEKILAQSETISQTIQTLERQRNTIRLMLENLQEGVILTDTDYHILAINQQALAFLSIRRNRDIIGDSLIPMLPKADWAALRGTADEMLYVQKLLISGSWYQLTVHPVYKNQDMYGNLFIIEDITEQKRREQLRREFTSNVSHEFKTPLTSIRGFSEILSAGMFQNREDVQHFGERIHEQADRLLAMIEETIHLSHIEELQKERPRQAVYLSDLVRDVAGFMEPVLQERKVTLHTQLERTAVWGEKDRLREVVMNLIDNAVKYNRPGGHIYVTVHSGQSQVQFIVEDTGIGIPEDKQKRVFERFYRADASRSQQVEGSGLGLAIVKHIAEQHQGRISLQSKADEGTLITVTFPLYDEEKAKGKIHE